jgi:para-aminobenzoate synthetase component 1
VIEFDHSRREVTIITCGGAEAISRARTLIAEAIAGDLTPARHADASAHTREGRATGGSWRDSDAQYLANIESCRAEIAAGNAYQLCLTNTYRVASSVDFTDALAVYRRLRRENPSHHGAFICLNETALLSSSPEVFLSVSADGRALTKPIKGTRPRGTTPDADRVLRDELETNVKERAENVMIVDLMRNDLSRVAVEGTVTVDALLTVESYANVHQLVSTVSAQLRPECSAADAVDACFPAGSMTGAPKISAMSILEGLEGDDRGIYSGIYGFLGDDGAAELAVVIRSVVMRPTGARIGSGGGLTIDSDPAAELAEMHLKAEPLLRALGHADTPVI